MHGANISVSAGSKISRMTKNSHFGGETFFIYFFFFKFYLKMRKCHAFAQGGGVEYFCDRNQSGARVNGAINSAAEDLCESWEMKKRQMGILTQ